MKTRRALLRYAGTLALIPIGLASADAGSGLAGPARAAAERAGTKVVVLKTSRGRTRGSATGFLGGPGLVVTAAHAVPSGTTVVAWLNGVPYRAEVADTHPALDLALLALRAPPLQVKPVELAASSGALEPGEPLVILAGPSQGPDAMGDPAARLPILAAFRNRRVLRDVAGREGPLLILDASVRRGDSGSPVLRARDGTVVGVLSSRDLPDAAGVSRAAYAVPVEALRPWLERRAPRPGSGEFYLLGLGKPAP